MIVRIFKKGFQKNNDIYLIVKSLRLKEFVKVLEKIKGIQKNLFSPEYPITIGLFRIGFGLIMLIHLSRIEEYIVDYLTFSKFFLKYDFFTWINITSAENLTLLFLLFKILAVLFMVGYFYRIAAIGLFIGWTYIFLLDAGHYNNHYYLYSLVLFLMVFIRADSWGSLSNLIHKKELRFLPKWNLWILQFQIVIVYFYGGIAKINLDWLQGYPMKLWLSDYGGFISTDLFALFISYAGLIFDLSVGFLLLFKSTRKWVILPLILFHISNHFFWNIGTFPFFAILATILFFPPKSVLNWFGLKLKSSNKMIITPSKSIKYFLLLFVLIQLITPLRPFFYQGEAAWNGLGQTFSWRMMLYSREHACKYKVKIPSDNIEAYVDINQYINYKQFKRLIREPKYAIQFGEFIGRTMEQNGAKNVEVYPYLWKSVNAREYQMLLDSNLNLMGFANHNQSAMDFILPMNNSPLGTTDYIIDLEEFQTKFSH